MCGGGKHLLSTALLKVQKWEEVEVTIVVHVDDRPFSVDFHRLTNVSDTNSFLESVPHDLHLRERSLDGVNLVVISIIGFFLRIYTVKRFYLRKSLWSN